MITFCISSAEDDAIVRGISEKILFSLKKKIDKSDMEASGFPRFEFPEGWEGEGG